MKKSAIFSVFFFACFLLPSAASAATIYVNSSTGNDSTGAGTSGSPYQTFNKGYTAASANDTLNLTGTFTWTDAGETGDAVTTGYTIGKNLTVIGQGPDQTVIQAASTDNTASARVFTISAGVTATFQNLTIRYGKVGSSGGCVQSGATTNVTFTTMEFYSCRATSTANGGAVYSSATTTISNSAFYSNVAGGSGGAISAEATAGRMFITNSTFYGNSQSSGSGGGAAIDLWYGQATLTNTTITGNTGNYGGGLIVYQGATLYLKNNIIASNTGNSSSNNDIYIGFSPTLTSNGYNIVGTYAGLATTTGDWTDTNNDGTYLKYGGGSGSLNLDSAGIGLNDGTTKTRTVAVLSGSIAADNGEGTTANNTIAIPSTDQRGATRNGTTDIGAYEFDGGGLSVSAPTTQTSGISFSSVEYDRMTVSWTIGNGARHAVFMKQGSTGTASPANGSRYTGNAAFGSGTQIGSSGWYAVYDGITGTSTTVTNIAMATSYIVQAFEYNGVGTGASVYMTATSTNNPNSQATYTPTTIYVNSSTGNDSTGAGTSGSPYQTFNKGYTVANREDTIDLTGTFTWTDAGETGDAATTGYTIAKDLIITGHGPDQTFIQATSTDNTASARVFTIGSSATTTIENLTMRYGKTASGACVFTNTGTVLTLNYVEIYSCRASGSGGGVYTSATTTISNSAIYNNVGDSSGGGVMASGAGARLFVTDSTIYGNTQTTGSGGGAGLQVNSSSQGTLTGVTITGNTGAYGGGISVYTSTTLYVKDSIIASNTGNSASNRDVYVLGGTLTSNGYNIVGNGLTATTGDWTDTNNDGTYNLYSTGTTGTLNLDSAAGINGNPNKTTTWAVLANSIAIDHGSNAGTNNGIAIPSTDQRGGGRSGTMDIGSYEYGAVTDTTAPTVSLTAPAASAVVAGASVSLSASASDNVSVSGVSFYVDNTLQGSEDTSSPYSIVWNSTATTTGAHSAFAVARDSSSNYATSSSVSFTVDNASPVLSSVSASPGSSSATVTWTSDEAASSQVNFGLTSSYGTSTAETDTSSRVTSHSVSLSGLVSCLQYHYQAQGKDASANTGTSTDGTFTTAGCTGSSSVSATGQSSITTASGGTLTQGALSITVPASFTATSSSAVFQANQLDGTAFFASAGSPAGVSRAGSTVFNLKALADATTTLSTFIQPITVRLTYSASDVSGLTESSLWIYRYDGSSWYALTGCSVNASARTVTCTTTSFSDFALFGQVAPAASAAATSSSSGGGLFITMAPRALPPAGALDFTIDNGDVSTGSVLVTLALNGDPGYVRGYAVSLDSSFAYDSIREYAAQGAFTLPDKEGTYALYLKYYSKTGNASPVISHTITYRKAPSARAPDVAAPSHAAAPGFPFARDLKRGDEGGDVLLLQRFLNNSGFALAPDGPGSKGNETPYFGSRTQTALIRFQKARKISPSAGYFGPITRGVMKKENLEP